VTYEFHLVAEDGVLRFGEGAYKQVWHLLRDQHSATGVALAGEPRSRIRVRADGAVSAPTSELLAQVAALAGTSLRYVLVSADVEAHDVGD
jgi:hypothetical protein